MRAVLPDLLLLSMSGGGRSCVRLRGSCRRAARVHCGGPGAVESLLARTRVT